MDKNFLQSIPFLVYLTPLILFWQQSRAFLLKIFRVFWKQRIIPYNFSFEFYKELKKKSFAINFDDYRLETIYYFSSKHQCNLPILIKMFNFELFLYKYFIPILIFGEDAESIKIQYLKFTFDFEKFMSEVVVPRQYNIIQNDNKIILNRFRIYTNRGLSLKLAGINLSNLQNNTPVPAFSQTQTNQTNPKFIIPAYRVINDKIPLTLGIDVKSVELFKPISDQDKYIFTKKGNYVLSMVKKWLDSEKWYSEKGIRYYRGFLLNGSAGTGKSSLILEIAKKLGIPIWIFDLQSFDNEEFEKQIDELPTESGVILFEDIDAIWNGRENKTKTDKFGGLTFDCFINKLSGVKGIKNKFVFITTNHVENLDAALLRPGRIDEKIKLESLNREEKIKMANIILDNNYELVNKLVEEGINDSTAEFENRVVQASLEKFWL